MNAWHRPCAEGADMHSGSRQRWANWDFMVFPQDPDCILARYSPQWGVLSLRLCILFF